MGRRSRQRLRKKRSTKLRIEDRLGHYLKELHLPYKRQCRIGRYNVDYLVNGKFIVECYGDFWHANPQLYEPSQYHRAWKCSAEDKWAHDKAREEFLRRMGYQFLALWEHEITYHEKWCKQKVKSLLTK